VRRNRRSSRAKWLAALALVAATAIVPSAIAQPCPVALPTNGTSLGYQHRAGPPRCEGTYISPVSGSAGFALVSLTFGRVSYLDQHQELHIRLPSAVAATRLRAVGLPQFPYYRLDAILPQTKPELRVPLGAVIKPEAIRAGDLGVFGLRDVSPTRQGYVPVIATSPGITPEAGVVAIVRPGADVLAVRWRLVAQGQPERDADWRPVDNGAGTVPGGTPLRIRLPAPLPAATSSLQITYFVGGVPDTNRFTLLAP